MTPATTNGAESGSRSDEAHPFTVCVFCGASPGNSPAYMAAAKQVAHVLADNGWALVFGGGTVGLMGAVASALVARGGQAHGVIPKALVEFEQAGRPGDGLPPEEIYGRTTVVDTMHERKALMGREADAFVALPGGFGTLEELFEIVTWNQLGIHSCPIVVLNVDGFYDGLLRFVRDAVAAGFIKESCANIISEAKTPDEIAARIREYRVAEGRFGLDWTSEGPESPRVEKSKAEKEKAEKMGV